MIKSIRSFLGLCTHTYTLIETIKITSDGVACGYRLILQCNHCGNIKLKDC